MTKLHQKLLVAIRERHADFQPSPESPERLKETEAFARDLADRGRVRFPLPDDYLAFLRELGRVPWPMEIGNVLDFRANDWPTAFVAFARDARVAHGFLLRHRGDGDENWPTVKDFENRAEQIEWEIGGARGEEAKSKRAEAAALRRQGVELAARQAKLQKQERTTKDLRIETVPLATRELREFDPDDGDDLSVFAHWLEFQMTSAELREKSAREAPPPTVAASASEGDDAVALQQALDLIDRLVAMELIEVGEGFDEDASARRLVSASREAERVLEVLVDLPGVEEVFASADDIESLLEK
jgi:hypothetical protein